MTSKFPCERKRNIYNHPHFFATFVQHLLKYCLHFSLCLIFYFYTILFICLIPVYLPPVSLSYLSFKTFLFLLSNLYFVCEDGEHFELCEVFILPPICLIFLYFQVLPILLFFSFLSYLLFPSSFLASPFIPPAPNFLVSYLTDNSDSDLELSMVRHQPEGLEQLQAQTQFTRKELQSLYRGFKNVWKQSSKWGKLKTKQWCFRQTVHIDYFMNPSTKYTLQSILYAESQILVVNHLLLDFGTWLQGISPLRSRG